MTDAVYKKVELIGTSSESFSAAAANAIAKAAESIRNISWFEVIDQHGRIVDGGRIEQYQVTLRVAFRVE